ncbi:MAG: hypothetical protein REI94_14245 [Moraxellaceae bacterium]|nr:hypothetical protein [Moraxellaceae bacterium]
MDLDAVPQEGNRTHAGLRKAVYARDAQGRMVVAPSAGWEVEEIVTTQAVDAMAAEADAARLRVQQGTASTLEYWMSARRMDVALLAQSTGLWQWRVRRHLQPACFAKLSPALLERYAQALGLNPEQLQRLP